LAQVEVSSVNPLRKLALTHRRLVADNPLITPALICRGSFKVAGWMIISQR